MPRVGLEPTTDGFSFCLVAPLVYLIDFVARCLPPALVLPSPPALSAGLALPSRLARPAEMQAVDLDNAVHEYDSASLVPASAALVEGTDRGLGDDAESGWFQ